MHTFFKKDGTCELVLKTVHKSPITCFSVTDRMCCGDESGAICSWEIGSLASGKAKKRNEKLQLAEEIARLQELGIDQNIRPKVFSLDPNTVILTGKEKKQMLKEIKKDLKPAQQQNVHPFLVGDMPRNVAEAELAKSKINSFLVRNSSVSGFFFLSSKLCLGEFSLVNFFFFLNKTKVVLLFQSTMSRQRNLLIF